MGRYNNVTTFPFNKRKQKRAERLTDDAVLDGLVRPEDAAWIDPATHKDFARRKGGDQRLEQFKQYAKANYDAQTNDAPAVLQSRSEQYDRELAVEAKNKEKLQNEIRNSPNVEPIKVDTFGEVSGESATLLERLNKKLNPRERLELLIFPLITIGALLIGASGILDYLSEYGPDKYAADPWKAYPYVAIPAVIGVGLELVIRSFKGDRAKQISHGAVIAIWGLSVLGVIYGLLGMSTPEGGGLSTSTSFSAGGIRFISQVMLEVSSISLVFWRLFEILDACWPEIYGAGRRKIALRKEMSRLDTDIIAPLKLKIERCAFWIPTYEAHREEYVQRELAVFEGFCIRHDDLPK